MSSTNPNTRWTTVGLLWMVCVLNYADRQAVFSVFPLLEKTYGFNKQELGLIGSAFMVVYAALSPLAGWVGDRFARKWIVVGGLCAWSTFTALTALCGKLWGFVLVRGAEGFGETFYFPASTSLIDDLHPARTRSRALGLHHTGTYVGTILGGALAGWCAEAYGWRAPFLVFGLAGLALGLFLMRFVSEPPRTHSVRSAKVADQSLDSRSRPKRGPTFALVATFCLANFVTLPFYAWLPTFLSEKFGIGLAEAAFTGTFYLQGSSAVGALFGGTLADMWKERATGGRVFTQAVGILGYAPFMFVLGSGPSLAATIGAMCAMGFFKGFYDANVWAALYESVPKARKATACGVANVLGWVGGSVSVFLVGLIVHRGWLSMGRIFELFPAISAVMAALLIYEGLANRDQDPS